MHWLCATENQEPLLSPGCMSRPPPVSPGTEFATAWLCFQAGGAQENWGCRDSLPCMSSRFGEPPATDADPNHWPRTLYASAQSCSSAIADSPMFACWHLCRAPSSLTPLVRWAIPALASLNLGKQQKTKNPRKQRQGGQGETSLRFSLRLLGKCLGQQWFLFESWDGRGRAIVIAEALARVI